nr:hypothetical protein [Tanacetum cinerariifolium]
MPWVSDDKAGTVLWLNHYPPYMAHCKKSVKKTGRGKDESSSSGEGGTKTTSTFVNALSSIAIVGTVVHVVVVATHAGSTWEELKHIRQAVGLLINHHRVPTCNNHFPTTTTITHNHHSTRTTCNNQCQIPKMLQIHNCNKHGTCSNGQDRHMQMVGGNGRNQFRQYAGQNVGNQNGYNAVHNVRNQNPNRNGNVVTARAEGNAIGKNADLDEIKKVNSNCILMANLQRASASGTQTDKAPVYDTNESVDNGSNVISEVSSVEQSRGTIYQHPATVEENCAYFESLYNNLAIEVEKVNTVNRKFRETNADLTTKLVRYKNQEKCFEISPEKYDKLKRCYQKSIYQEQCLTKKINALHLSSSKQITTFNEEISKLNNQLSKEKSTVSSLQEEKKKLKSDFKIREDELLDKQIKLETKIKELDNILVKTGKLIQMMCMLSPKPDSFYHTAYKMALGYQNLFYLKQAQQKQQSLYNGKVLLEKHDPPVVYDLEETLQLA